MPRCACAHLPVPRLARVPFNLDLLTALLRGHTDRDDEAAVLSLLRQASDPDFDHALASVDAAELFASLDDRLLGPDHRTALRNLILERLEALSVPALANVVYGLQAGHTDGADAETIAAVFLAVGGEQLTAVKNAINNRPDHHDLEELVFADIADEEVRATILAHIAAESVGVHPGGAKVLCDIDDTVAAALHDRRFPRGTVYPGVLAVLDALDRGPEDAAYSLGDLTFVTARPGDLFGLIENHTRATLRRAGIASHSVLTGTFAALASHDLMAARKIANIAHYRQLFPESRLVFIGYSGQGDVTVGELVRERFAGFVDAVLIHDVVDTPAAVRAERAERGIATFDTYLGAALLLRRAGLISAAAVARVHEQSVVALDAIVWDSPEQERRARDAFAADVARLTAADD